jgi:hypothetical protein
MNRDFVTWLTTQRLPMFDIRCLTIEERWVDGAFHDEGYELIQRAPAKSMHFICRLDQLAAEARKEFPLLRSPVGELALKTAIQDLQLNPWWGTAGPITEELRATLRLGVRLLATTDIGSPRKSHTPAGGGVPLVGVG